MEAIRYPDLINLDYSPANYHIKLLIVIVYSNHSTICWWVLQFKIYVRATNKHFFSSSSSFQCGLIKKTEKKSWKSFRGIRFSRLSCRTSIQQVYRINVPFVTMIMIICKVETGPGCLVEWARVRPWTTRLIVKSVTKCWCSSPPPHESRPRFQPSFLTRIAKQTVFPRMISVHECDEYLFLFLDRSFETRVCKRKEKKEKTSIDEFNVTRVLSPLNPTFRFVRNDCSRSTDRLFFH